MCWELDSQAAVLAKMEGNDWVAEGTGFLPEGCSVVKPGLFLPPPPVSQRTLLTPPGISLQVRGPGPPSTTDCASPRGTGLPPLLFKKLREKKFSF